MGRIIQLIIIAALLFFAWRWWQQHQGASPTHVAAGGDGCTPYVDSATNAWSNGMTESITITSAAAVNGWSLVFTLPSGQTITGGWNATYSPSTGQVTAKNVSYNASIAAGGSVTIGFQGTHTGNSAAPTAFSLNGNACTIG